MAVVTTDIDINICDFDTYELREELELRGYYVSADGISDVEDLSDRDLIDELNRRGYTVYGKKADIPWEIYQSYLLDDDKKFRDSIKKVLIENGYKP